MKLLDLEPEFVRATEGGFERLESIEGAQGIFFKCPRCYHLNGDTIVGTHMILCWSNERGAPPDRAPLPGRWRIEGAGVHDLTLNTEPPAENRSVQVTGGCNAHFHITNGEISFC